MANKRISELAPITAVELVQQDLFLLADVSAHESKRLTVDDLETYFLSTGDFFTGSFYGTASWALKAITASYINGVDSASYAKTSSWAFNIATAIAATYATSALSSSYAKTSSYAITASYALTSSVQLSTYTTWADNAKTASFLLYTGIPNGTASFSISSSYAKTSSYANTSSYALNGVIPKSSYDISCSWASRSLRSEYSLNSYTTDYLTWYPGVNNGTASYAMATGITPGVRTNYGVHKATYQDLLQATIDCVNITPSIDGFSSSSIEALGTVFLPFTTSVVVDGLLKLFSLDKWSGITQSIDSSSIQSAISPPLSGAYASTGSLKLPFSLMGEVPMSGSNILYIVASNGIRIDPFRTVRYDITSLSDNITFATGEAMTFQAFPTSALFYYTSSGVLYTGTAANIVSAGVNTITAMQEITGALTSMKYVWTLPNLSILRCGSNYSLTDIGGLPPSITQLYCANCIMPKLAPFAYTSMTRLECQYNNLIRLPDLSPSTTYVNCSNNLNLVSLSTLPSGLTTIMADYIGISAPPLVFPNSLVTMSFANNLALALWYTPLPTSMTYFDCHNTSLTQLPTLPAGVLYLDVSSCKMTPTAIENITTTLVTNGLWSGRLKVNNNNITYSATSITNFATLTGMGWTVTS